MTLSSRSEGEVRGDRVLLDAACAGDERAFGVLLARHRAGLEEACGLMLGDPKRTEQAMVATVLTAWRERGLASSCPSVRVWLYRIAVRECMEALGCPR
jgi:DNA-directed RNA polymerase specialized sigma24 family protein